VTGPARSYPAPHYRAADSAVLERGAPEAASAPPRLLLDQTLGRLARWLRLLGCDTVWDRSAGPAELLARAQREDRVLLTRDTLLGERREVRRGLVRTVLVRDDLLVDQLRQLRIEEGLHLWGEPRCMVCNSPLEPRTLQEVREWVPPYVAQTQTRFTYCPSCNRVTWQATHWKRMERRLVEAGFGDEEDGSGRR